MRFFFNKGVIFLPILFIGVLLGIVNILHLIIVICIGLLLLNRNEATFVLFLGLNTIAGLIFPILGFNIPGSLITLAIGLLLQNTRILKLLKLTNIISIKYILVILCYFTFYYLISDFGKYATEKILYIYMTTIRCSFAFIVLLHSKDIDLKKISIIFILIAIFQIAFAYNVYGYQLPNGIFDFDNFRTMTSMIKHSDLPYISYHAPAITAVLSLSFYICTKKRLKFGVDIIFLLTTFWIVLMCGARQAVISYVMVLLLWLFIKEGKINLWNFIIITFIGVLFYGILANLEIDFLQRMFESKGSLEENMNRNIEYPIELIKSVPVFGIGFGNYLNPYTFEWYPHNILFEIIIELGLLGFTLLLGIIIVFCVINKFSIYHKLPNGAYTVILILPYLMRSMISEHIGTNIVVFLILFILCVDMKHSILNQQRSR